MQESARLGSGSRPPSVDVLVEIPRGSRQKYELDTKSGRIRLDRVLFSSVHYPADYGFVMDTTGNDGDPLDALVVVEEPTFPGCIVPARPIGTLMMRDEHGDDEKILSVAAGDPRFDEVRSLRDLGRHWLREIETFFATYKELETAKPSEVRDWRDVDVAWQLIDEARARARKR
jgi:inorganic pyrophosphatase